MQLIKLSMPFGEEPKDFYCPVTGRKILSAEDCDSSPATVGIWTNFLPNEPVMITERLTAAWSEFMEDDERLDEEGVDGFLASVDIDGMVAFEITSSGMACGPISSTVWLVIDMFWKEND